MPFSKPRGSVSTFLISALVDPIAGLLWIGRGKLALIAAIVLYGTVAAVCYWGFPPFSIKGFPSMVIMELLVKNTLAVGVCVLAASAIPKWYSSGSGLVPVYILGSMLLALVVRSFVLQPFNAPSSSMTPALVTGDYFFVSKTAYGYSRYSFPFGLIPIEGRAYSSTPERGDIAVFRSEDGADYVKRIVGLPGETIQMIDGVLNIDGSPVVLKMTGSYVLDEGASNRSVEILRETLPNGVSYPVLNMADNSTGDSTEIFSVPAGHYFMMGDNRDNSSDSRFNIGTVPFENLIGKAVRIFWNSEGADYSQRRSLIPKAVAE